MATSLHPIHTFRSAATRCGHSVLRATYSSEVSHRRSAAVVSARTDFGWPRAWLVAAGAHLCDDCRERLPPKHVQADGSVEEGTRPDSIPLAPTHDNLACRPALLCRNRAWLVGASRGSCISDRGSILLRAIQVVARQGPILALPGARRADPKLRSGCHPLRTLRRGPLISFRQPSHGGWLRAQPM